MRKFGLLIASVCLFVWNGQAQIAECDINDELGQNLIVNGDFEQGNTGFNTDLTLFAGSNSNEFYYLGSDPKVFNAAFSGSDHTSGTGNMLMLDASNDASKTKMWYQSVEVKPNTNYFFTAHISNILGPNSQIIPQLVFTVNGEVLNDTIDAPINTFEWNSFTSVWYSGANPPQFVEITIENIKTGGGGEGGGNDMALDDISFIEGCGFGGLGEEPNLGEDIQTICGSATGELVLTAAATAGITYEYKWDTPSNDDTLNTLVVSEPGVYGLCMTTDGSCPRLKTVTVTNDFSVSLGDDIDLCSPSTTTLIPDYLKGEKYDWFKDGVGLGQFRNEKSATVNEVGIYKLVVTDANASCGQREDEVIVGSSTIQAVNGYFCPDDALAVDLSITNMLSDPSNYKWYSDEALTTEVATGGTFTTPADLTETTTYWVKDESELALDFGPLVANHSSNGWGDNDAAKFIEFTALTDMVLDTVSVYPITWNTSNMSIGISILEWDGGMQGEPFNKSIEFTPTANCCDGSPKTEMKFPIGVNLEKGKTYRIRRVGDKPTWIYGSNSGAIDLSTMNNQPDYIQIDGFSLDTQMPGFFDWKITAGSPCDPIEVQAIYDPVRCSECETPDDVTIDVAGALPLKCTTDEVTLTANVAGGIGTWDYAWMKDGQPVGDNSATITVTKADAGKYTVDVTEQLEPAVCFLSSNEETITTEEPLEASVSLNTDLSQSQCLVGSVSATATAVNITAPVYSWTVNGDGTQSQDIATLSLAVADGDIVEVTVTGKDECDEDVSEIANATIIGEDEITPSAVINGADGLCDTETAALTATIDPSTLTNITYNWEVNDVLASTDPTYTVALKNDDKVKLTLTFGGTECLFSTEAVDSTVAEVSTSTVPNVSIDVEENDLCADDLPMIFNPVASGAGTLSFEWFVKGESKGTEPQFKFDVEDGDDVTVIMTTTDACATSPTATSDPIVANVIPMVDAEVSITGGNEACSGQDLTFTADVQPAGAGSLQWTVDGNDVTGETGTTFTSNGLSNGEVVSVVFTSTEKCRIKDDVSATSDITISIVDPTVSISSIYEGDLCSGKDNGYEVSSRSLGGTSPIYSWSVNSVIDPLAVNSIERDDLKEGDTVRVVMTPNPANGCPNATAEAVLGAFQDAFEISLNVGDSVLCAGSTLNISASTLNGGLAPKYQWYKNDQVMIDDTLSSISVTGEEDDEYKVVFESSLYCIDDTLATDSITLHVVEVPVAEAGPSIALEDYIETTLDGSESSIGVFNYVWSAADTLVYESMDARQTIKTTVTPIEKFTMFYLSVSNTEEGVTCSDKDSTDVTVSFDFPVPNAFSPNGDGANEVFEIDNLDKLDSFTLQIYNRWGSLLYEQKSATEFWDGTKGGSPVPASTYFYLFTYELDGETTTQDGYISLIR